jgi:voltage-gated potassium channel
MAATNTELKNTTYEAFVGLLSVLSIVNIGLIYLADSAAVEAVVMIIDGALSLIFLADFAYRLLSAEDRRIYFFRQFGWADLLASVPLPGQDTTYFPNRPRLSSRA